MHLSDSPSHIKMRTQLLSTCLTSSTPLFAMSTLTWSSSCFLCAGVRSHHQWMLCSTLLSWCMCSQPQRVGQKQWHNGFEFQAGMCPALRKEQQPKQLGGWQRIQSLRQQERSRNTMNWCKAYTALGALEMLGTHQPCDSVQSKIFPPCRSQPSWPMPQRSA